MNKQINVHCDGYTMLTNTINMVIFMVKIFVVYKIFNVALKFEGKNFMAETVIIIVKATYDNPMVVAVLL